MENKRLFLHRHVQLLFMVSRVVDREGMSG